MLAGLAYAQTSGSCRLRRSASMTRRVEGNVQTSVAPSSFVMSSAFSKYDIFTCGPKKENKFCRLHIYCVSRARCKMHVQGGGQSLFVPYILCESVDSYTVPIGSWNYQMEEKITELFYYCILSLFTNISPPQKKTLRRIELQLKYFTGTMYLDFFQ